METKFALKYGNDMLFCYGGQRVYIDKSYTVTFVRRNVVSYGDFLKDSEEDLKIHALENKHLSLCYCFAKVGMFFRVSKLFQDTNQIEQYPNRHPYAIFSIIITNSPLLTH